MSNGPMDNNKLDESSSVEGLKDKDVLTEGPQYSNPLQKNRVKWYRCKVSKTQLAKLNKRSNFLGFCQTLGHLGVLGLGAGGAIYSSLYWAWYITLILIFINGHFWHFIGNGFHELVHYSVFKTRWLNLFFLRIYAFLGWQNPHHFWASHTEHHKYTLHYPNDQEVVLPQKFEVTDLWKWAIFNYRYPYDLLKGKVSAFLGVMPNDNWSKELFPKSDPSRQRAYSNWERITLVGHLLIMGISLIYGLWVVPLVITFPKMIGAWLQFLCNATQHVGLQDDVPDFRLCCRTFYLNPFLQFIYWHMNYHTEHHMYAAVPCYKLGKLHHIIEDEMPYCTSGLIETWKQISKIMERQKKEPGYQYVPLLPSPQSTNHNKLNG